MAIPPSQDLAGRRVLLALTGGIAAYKAAYVVQGLVGRGASVRAVMTHGATRFLGARTLEALTGRPVLTDLFAGGGGVDHIELARWAEVALVAPATANVLAKMSWGVADDPVTTVLLATPARVLVAPAMNDGMWRHPATQENVARLEARGVVRVGPDAGFLAEGYAGPGRMVEPPVLVAAVAEALGAVAPDPGGD